MGRPLPRVLLLLQTFLRRVPAALALQEVSRQAERIASAAPTLLSAMTPADHAESSRKIAAEMQELAALLEGLENRGADSAAVGSIRSAVNRLQINLEALDKQVADRMVISELKRGHLRNALITHGESQSLLTRGSRSSTARSHSRAG